MLGNALNLGRHSVHLEIAQGHVKFTFPAKISKEQEHPEDHVNQEDQEVREGLGLEDQVDQAGQEDQKGLLAQEEREGQVEQED